MTWWVEPDIGQVVRESWMKGIRKGFFVLFSSMALFLSMLTLVKTKINKTYCCCWVHRIKPEIHLKIMNLMKFKIFLFFVLFLSHNIDHEVKDILLNCKINMHLRIDQYEKK